MNQAILLQVTNIPANEVTITVPEDAAPIIPHKQLAPKKTFVTELVELENNKS